MLASVLPPERHSAAPAPLADHRFAPMAGVPAPAGPDPAMRRAEPGQSVGPDAVLPDRTGSAEALRTWGDRPMALIEPTPGSGSAGASRNNEASAPHRGPVSYPEGRTTDTPTSLQHASQVTTPSHPLPTELSSIVPHAKALTPPVADLPSAGKIHAIDPSLAQPQGTPSAATSFAPQDSGFARAAADLSAPVPPAAEGAGQAGPQSPGDIRLDDPGPTTDGQRTPVTPARATATPGGQLVVATAPDLLRPAGVQPLSVPIDQVPVATSGTAVVWWAEAADMPPAPAGPEARPRTERNLVSVSYHPILAAASAVPSPAGIAVAEPLPVHRVEGQSDPMPAPIAVPADVMPESGRMPARVEGSGMPEPASPATTGRQPAGLAEPVTRPQAFVAVRLAEPLVAQPGLMKPADRLASLAKDIPSVASQPGTIRPTVQLPAVSAPQTDPPPRPLSATLAEMAHPAPAPNPGAIPQTRPERGDSGVTVPWDRKASTLHLDGPANQAASPRVEPRAPLPQQDLPRVPGLWLPPLPAPDRSGAVVGQSPSSVPQRLPYDKGGVASPVPAAWSARSDSSNLTGRTSERDPAAELLRRADATAEAQPVPPGQGGAALPPPSAAAVPGLQGPEDPSDGDPPPAAPQRQDLWTSAGSARPPETFAQAVPEKPIVRVQSVEHPLSRPDAFSGRAAPEAALPFRAVLGPETFGQSLASFMAGPVGPGLGSLSVTPLPDSALWQGPEAAHPSGMSQGAAVGTANAEPAGIPAVLQPETGLPEPALATPDRPDLSAFRDTAADSRTPAQPAVAQVSTALVRHAAAPTQQPIEVILAPEELGRLQVTLRQEGETMHVHLVAERPETLELLRRNCDLLAQDLRQSGFLAASFSFGASSGRADARPSEPEKAIRAPLASDPAAFVTLPASGNPSESGLYLRL